MGTSYQTPITGFLRRVEADRDFFYYYSLTPEAASKLALERAVQYLHEAAVMVQMKCRPSVDFTNYDDEQECFAETLTAQEVFLLSSLMYEAYLNRDIAKLKTMTVNYASKELQVYDPSNARTSFLALYKQVKEENDLLLDIYKNTDRMTGAFNDINYGTYDE